MTDVEFAILIFGTLIAVLLIIILTCVIIFKIKNRKTKKFSDEEFNEILSQNDKLIVAEKQSINDLQKSRDKNINIDI